LEIVVANIPINFDPPSISPLESAELAASQSVAPAARAVGAGGDTPPAQRFATREIPVVAVEPPPASAGAADDERPNTEPLGSPPVREAPEPASGALSESETLKLLMDMAVLQEDLDQARTQAALSRKHVELVQEQLARVTAEKNAGQEQSVRLKAEFDNYRKRAERERQEASFQAHSAVMTSMLEVLDNLDRALANGKSETGNLQDFLQGVELIQKQLIDGLAVHGVTVIPALGGLFDPTMHEAIAAEVTTEHAPNTVIEELKRGYFLGDRLLRPAMVRVAMSPPKSASESDESPSA
jgi:molecular chaperone GrpE